MITPWDLNDLEYGQSKLLLPFVHTKTSETQSNMFTPRVYRIFQQKIKQSPPDYKKTARETSHTPCPLTLYQQPFYYDCHNNSTQKAPLKSRSQIKLIPRTKYRHSSVCNLHTLAESLPADLLSKAYHLRVLAIPNPNPESLKNYRSTSLQRLVHIRSNQSKNIGKNCLNTPKLYFS